MILRGKALFTVPKKAAPQKWLTKMNTKMDAQHMLGNLTDTILGGMGDTNSKKLSIQEEPKIAV